PEPIRPVPEGVIVHDTPALEEVIVHEEASGVIVHDADVVHHPDFAHDNDAIEHDAGLHRDTENLHENSDAPDIVGTDTHSDTGSDNGNKIADLESSADTHAASNGKPMNGNSTPGSRRYDA